MQIKHYTTLIDSGEFSQQAEFSQIKKEVDTAIKNVVWPIGSDKFTIYPQSGKKTGEGNGVVPIKKMFQANIKGFGWELEKSLDIATLKQPGHLDAAKAVGTKYFAIEWETGNISSSHRAINKMALGIIKDVLIGGILILPTRTLYPYLTDRIGNFAEIEPYFPLWRSIKCDEGFLQIIAIEHDATSYDVPKIPKGTDGRALV